jgi:hypothetical protein
MAVAAVLPRTLPAWRKTNGTFPRNPPGENFNLQGSPFPIKLKRITCFSGPWCKEKTCPICNLTKISFGDFEVIFIINFRVLSLSDFSLSFSQITFNWIKNSFRHSIQEQNITSKL